MKKVTHSILFGVAVGDALGVPVEFKPRSYLNQFPVADMLEYGSHHQPKGTWSDDSSLTFCLAEMLCSGYDLQNLANRFINWTYNGYWTAHGRLFDIGIATRGAIDLLESGCSPVSAGGKDEYSNGNGSLMRILPLVVYIKDFEVQQRFEIVKNVSSLTHAHIRSCVSCFIYLEVALQLIEGYDKLTAYKNGTQSAYDFLLSQPICSEAELQKFKRILFQMNGQKMISDYDESEIHSSGYVLHSLEASLWCLLNLNSYKEIVLKAVNMGEDTDTTGAIAGGLAGLAYGYNSIPDEWIQVIAKREEIDNLSERLEGKYFKNENSKTI